jgi:hypothetical protein
LGEWFGWSGILYFFVSLLGYQVIPKTPDRGGGLQNATLNLAFILSPPEAASVIIVFAQLAVVLIMIITLLLVFRENGYGGARVTKIARNIFNEPLELEVRPEGEGKDTLEEGKKQLKQFKKYFLYFWCVTFLLYVVFLLDPQIEIGSHSESPIAHMVELLLYPALEFLLSSLNLLCIFWCFVVLQSPAFGKRSDVRQKLLINYSSFVVLLLIAIFPLLLFMIGGPELSKENLTDYATIFDGVTGTLSAVGLALLIARMDSKLFDLPARLIWMLFAYVSIQPLFIAFAQNLPVLQMVKASVLVSALGLKICFFLIVAHSLQSGRALNYLICFPFLKERVDSIFENQFEIRTKQTEGHLFAVSILKQNQLYYSIEKRFRSRRGCDGFVRYLRKRMKDRNAYLPSRKGWHINSRSHEELGTYWVELRSGEGKLICESIPLRTQEEADDLIAESMERIPYCKYNRT